MSDEKKEKKDNGGLEEVARKAIEIAKSVAAEVRKLKEQLVNEGVISNPAATMSGAEAYRMKGKSGHVKVTALVGVAMLFAVITGGLFAANELVWKVGDSAYVDMEGDAYFNGVTTVNGVVDTRLSALEAAGVGGTLAPAYVIVGNASTVATAVAVSGDVTMAANGAVTIAANAVEESMLKAVDTAADEDFLTYESTTGDFEWHSIANVAGGIAAAITEGQLADSIVVSADIKDEEIVNADLSATAAIAHSKLATDGLGAVVAGTGTQTESVTVPAITVITFTNVVVAATDGTAEGESVKIFDADAGQFTLLAAIANCTIVSSAGTTGDFVAGFGTEAASDAADLTSTEVDVIPSTAISTTGGTVLTNAFDAVLATPIGMDGTATAKDIYFNFGIADAAMDANNSTNTVTGTLTIITTKCVTNQ